jgi:hypothetical protein
MRTNKPAPATHESTPAAGRSRRVSTAATEASRSPRAARGPSPVRPDDDQIRLRAYELSLQRDGHHGDPLEDWLRAERELIGQTPPPETPARARRAPARKQS